MADERVFLHHYGERGGTLQVGWLCFHIEAVWC